MLDAYLGPALRKIGPRTQDWRKAGPQTQDRTGPRALKPGKAPVVSGSSLKLRELPHDSRVLSEAWISPGGAGSFLKPGEVPVWYGVKEQQRI